MAPRRPRTIMNSYLASGRDNRMAIELVAVIGQRARKRSLGGDLTREWARTRGGQNIEIGSR